MCGVLVATHIAVYNFFNQSGLSSGGTIFRFLLPPRPGPFGRPAINQAKDPMPGTKMIITSHDHLGRLLIRLSSVREQSMIEKIVSAVTRMIPMTAARSMTMSLAGVEKRC
jgi:hypothetical protein